jgi:tRNA U34 5-methylaminomethyl-2-thiouridine-forming methyltransferase MnmC
VAEKKLYKVFFEFQDMNRILKISNDGSHTVYDAAIDEHFHSVHGAITESQHVFIKNGFGFSDKSELTILEIGFGTGLNVFLTLIEAMKTGTRVVYDSIDLYPLDADILNKLNYAQILTPELLPAYNRICNCAWNEKSTITDGFVLNKISENALFIEWKETYDLIYFDAFSPEKQPEMWAKEFFGRIFNVMNPGAVLVTYCAKGVVKRTLKDIGYNVELLSGPPGKRQMLRAVK